MFFRVTLASWASRVRALLVQLRGPDGAAIPGDGVEVVQPMGLRARPVVRASTEALVLELPNGERLAFVIDKARDEGAVEPEAGETQLHGLASQSAVVRIRASGAVEITAASGQPVTLQGGTQPYVCGTAYADALGTALDALSALLTALGVFATAVGPGVPVAGPAAAVTLNAAVVTCKAALTVFKAARASYLSTRIAGL